MVSIQSILCLGPGPGRCPTSPRNTTAAAARTRIRRPHTITVAGTGGQWRFHAGRTIRATSTRLVLVVTLAKQSWPASKLALSSSSSSSTQNDGVSDTAVSFCHISLDSLVWFPDNHGIVVLSLSRMNTICGNRTHMSRTLSAFLLSQTTTTSIPFTARFQYIYTFLHYDTSFTATNIKDATVERSFVTLRLPIGLFWVSDCRTLFCYIETTDWFVLGF